MKALSLVASLLLCIVPVIQGAPIEGQLNGPLERKVDLKSLAGLPILGPLLAGFAGGNATTPTATPQATGAPLPEGNAPLRKSSEESVSPAQSSAAPTASTTSKGLLSDLLELKKREAAAPLPAPKAVPQVITENNTNLKAKATKTAKLSDKAHVHGAKRSLISQAKVAKLNARSHLNGNNAQFGHILPIVKRKFLDSILDQLVHEMKEKDLSSGYSPVSLGTPMRKLDEDEDEEDRSSKKEKKHGKVSQNDAEDDEGESLGLKGIPGIAYESVLFYLQLLCGLQLRLGFVG
ncbi:uncharacterized protein VTP21DRAFT_2733 [Calcarisporiella thermophila]|uniref:uncharacterized protein n=1 Tax=Calcarisporiella thermophila TaxID=911321 RepID=UPI00374214CD